jgi:hypothetical protein
MESLASVVSQPLMAMGNTGITTRQSGHVTAIVNLVPTAETGVSLWLHPGTAQAEVASKSCMTGRNIHIVPSKLNQVTV